MSAAEVRETTRRLTETRRPHRPRHPHTRSAQKRQWLREELG